MTLTAKPAESQLLINSHHASMNEALAAISNRQSTIQEIIHGLALAQYHAAIILKLESKA